VSSPAFAALDALILVRLDGRRGEYVGVSELSRYLRSDPALVAERIAAIEVPMRLHVQRVAGMVYAAATPLLRERPPCA
jgi:hypothetical protein